MAVLELRTVVRIMAWFTTAIADRLLLARLPSSLLPGAVLASVVLRRTIFLVILVFFRTMFSMISVLIVPIRVCL